MQILEKQMSGLRDIYSIWIDGWTTDKDVN